MDTIIINKREHVTMSRAAELIGCSYKRIAWLVSEGRLPAITPGREKLVAVADVEQFREPLKRGPRAKS